MSINFYFIQILHSKSSIIMIHNYFKIKNKAAKTATATQQQQQQQQQ